MGAGLRHRQPDPAHHHGHAGQVFPSVEIWRMAPSTLLLVATRTELAHDVARLRTRMQQEPFRSALLGAWSTTTLEGVLAHHVARPSLVRRVAELQGSAINTDDRTRVEFGFARSLTGTGNVHAGDIEALARARGEDQPAWWVARSIRAWSPTRRLVLQRRSGLHLALAMTTISASVMRRCRMAGQPLRKHPSHVASSVG